MSTKMTKLVLAVGAMAMAGGAMAANVDASATATVVVAIQIGKDADLAFGKFIASPTLAGTVVVPTSGVRVLTNLSQLGGTVSAAAFTVTGTANTTYSISLPHDIMGMPEMGVELTSTNGGTMPVSAFSAALVSGGTSTGNSLGVLSSTTNGALVTQKFKVGATLAVAAAQAPGNYTGTFSVSVDYQ